MVENPYLQDFDLADRNRNAGTLYFDYHDAALPG